MENKIRAFGVKNFSVSIGWRKAFFSNETQNETFQ